MSSQHPEPHRSSSGISPLTLAIASASSVVAAIVVSKVWGTGTLIGAAVTPVIVTLVNEALRKPAEKITVVRVSSTGAEVRERDAPTGPAPVPGALAPPSIHRSRRSPVAVAVAGGLLAFVIGAAVLTFSELVLGDRSVGSGSERTTIFRGRSSGGTATTQTQPATPTTPAPTGTQETPATPTAPDTTRTTPTVPPATTAPPATPPPAGPGDTQAPATGATGP